MSRSIKGSKGPGYDFWSRRPPNTGCQGHGKDAKKLTHRLERKQNKEIARKEKENLENDKDCS